MSDYVEKYRYRARAAYRLHTLGFKSPEIGALMGISTITASQYVREVKDGKF